MLKKENTKPGLTKTEGVLECIFIIAAIVIAFYAAWNAGAAIFSVFLIALLVPSWLHYVRVCTRCKNKCPVNPDRRFWKS